MGDQGLGYFVQCHFPSVFQLCGSSTLQGHLSVAGLPGHCCSHRRTAQNSQKSGTTNNIYVLVYILNEKKEIYFYFYKRRGQILFELTRNIDKFEVLTNICRMSPNSFHFQPPHQNFYCISSINTGNTSIPHEYQFNLAAIFLVFVMVLAEFWCTHSCDSAPLIKGQKFSQNITGTSFLISKI